MGHAQNSTHSVLGRINLATLGRPHADQLRRTFRRWHSAALAYWPERQRRIAHRRHHYCGARPPLRQLHAKLSKSYSARGRSDPSHSRNDRTFFLRSNLRRLVESKRLIRRQSCGRTIGRALSTSNRIRRELQLETARGSFCFPLWKSPQRVLSVIARSNLE